MYGINKDNIDIFLAHPIVLDWNVLEIYYAIKRSARQDKDEILEIYENHSRAKGIIQRNDLAVKEHQKKEAERLEQEKKKKRDEIESICKHIVEKDSFSEYLLHLYENDSELFLDEEVDIIKNQIDKILSDEEFFDPKK